MHLTGLFLLLVTGWAVGVASLVVYTVYSLTHPPRRSFAYAVSRKLPSTPAEIELTENSAASALSFSEWAFASRGFSFPVWDVQGLRPDGPTLVLTHGWGDSRVTCLTRLASLAPLACRVVLWDLPGHGEAPGTCSLGAHEVDDLLALVRVVGAKPSRPIVLYGFSLGAGVSIAAAARLCTSPAGAGSVSLVVAEAPYRLPVTPARNVLRLAGLPHQFNLRPAMALLGMRSGQGISWATSPIAGGFDRALHARRLTVPLLVLHGSSDQVSPVADGRAIAAAAPHASFVQIDGGGHLDLWTRPELALQCERALAAALAPLASPS